MIDPSLFLEKSSLMLRQSNYFMNGYALPRKCLQN
jgi:hypothetical protein